MNYLKKNGIFCVLLFLLSVLTVSGSALCADADGDGVLSAADARTALRIAVDLESATQEQKLACDLDYDQEISAADAREILRLSVGYGRSDDSGADGMEDAQLVGVTDTYYKIYEKEGITYIDGIIIANKTYSLPTEYAPGKLLTECADAFTALQEAAAGDGERLFINSGYRSYASQEEIYNSYVFSYGLSYAEAYAARPGHSEHQTGLAIDVTNSSGWFTGSSQAKWLAEHCADYGFILRYPEGKNEQTGYNAESWHIRYVGEQIAEKISNSGLCLEEYYGIDSVYAQEE